MTYELFKTIMQSQGNWPMSKQAIYEHRQAEIDRLLSRFTKLDMPRYSGAPMLDSVLAEENPRFRAWVATLPPEYWARYDLSAVRIGWEGAKND